MKETVGIIGGGIVGSTAAYYLSRAGINVTLYDEGIGQATKAAAGIICPWFSLRRNKPWYNLVSQGAEFYTKLMFDLQEDGYNTENIYQKDGAIFIRKDNKRIYKDLEMAKQKIQDSPSIGHVKYMSAQEIIESCPIIDTDKDGLFVEGGGRVHGDKLIETLQNAAVHYNCKIIRSKAKICPSIRHQIITEFSKETYNKILLSSGAWLPDILQPLGYHVDLQPQKGQLFTLYNEKWKNQHWPVIIPYGQGDIIPFNNGSLTIGATHENNQAYNLTIDKAHLEDLKNEIQKWMPNINRYPVQEIRVGTRAQTSDYSVILGEIPELTNIWTISGLGSSGLTSGPYLGYQWSQLILTDQWDISIDDYPINKYIYKK